MKNVVFFDGECGLCDQFVQFILRIDSKKAFYFSPLQGEYAAKNLSQEYTQDLKTVVLQLEDGRIFKKSQAVFMIFRVVGAPWSSLSLLRFFPRAMTDIGYDLVAKNRYRLFGKLDICRLPTPSEQSRII